jgi:subtilisin
MVLRRRARFGAIAIAAAWLASPGDSQILIAQQLPRIPADIALRAQTEGTARVIVQLNVPTQPDGQLVAAAAQAQRAAIAATQNRATNGLAGTTFRLMRQFETIPFVALEVAPDALAALAQSPDVAAVFEDRLSFPSLPQSVPLVEGTSAWNAGFDGTGWTVAVLDTGIDKNHSFLVGKVVSEACYSAGSDCPNGGTTLIGTNAGEYCTYALQDCRHGTHVAGIVAGRGPTFSGVARGANLISIQVFSRFDGTTECPPPASNPCAKSYDSDQIVALERVYALRTTFNIAAVNMSLGSDIGYTSQADCDAIFPGKKMAIDNLRSVGIATVISSGNEFYANALAAPACISSAVSVGSTTKSDVVSTFSNSASFLSLLAPGESITSSVPGGGFAVFSGTSMAAPHVAGAWAILKQRSPGASVTTILSALRNTGLLLTDTGSGVTTPRIRILRALNTFPSTLSLFINDVRLAEGQSGTTNAPFTVWLTGGPNVSGVTVNYTTVNGTATAAGDFVGGSGLLTIPAPNTSALLAIQVTGDTAIEPSETFSVALSNATGATIADGTGVATIVNDDYTDPTLSGVLIKTTHIYELRAAIQEARAARGLGTFAFTDPVLSPQVTAVRAVHITEMRTALAQAFTAALLTPWSYTVPVITPGVMSVRAVDILELRAALAYLH